MTSAAGSQYVEATDLNLPQELSRLAAEAKHALKITQNLQISTFMTKGMPRYC